MILDARKRNNASMLLYLKAKRYPPEGSKTQEANRNMTEEKNPNYRKESWRKKLGLPSEMDINVVHRYSRLG